MVVMEQQANTFKTIVRRPIDCSRDQMNSFARIVLQSKEVPLENLKRGLPSAEMLFFTTTVQGEIAGVSAIRFQNKNYHRHLFEQAGVLHMYNPHSVESCWLSVRPEFRGKGVWKSNRQARLDYLGSRPCHVIRRVENAYLVVKKSIYQQAGDNFYSQTSDDKLMLLVYNHDPVFDANKRLRYV